MRKMEKRGKEARESLCACLRDGEELPPYTERAEVESSWLLGRVGSSPPWLSLGRGCVICGLLSICKPAVSDLCCYPMTDEKPSERIMPRVTQLQIGEKGRVVSGFRALLITVSSPVRGLICQLHQSKFSKTSRVCFVI